MSGLASVLPSAPISLPSAMDEPIYALPAEGFDTVDYYDPVRSRLVSLPEPRT